MAQITDASGGNVAGFVLTGGRSTRMGTDKALLPFGGQTICEHIADTVSGVAGEVLLVGRPERYAHLKYRCVADREPDRGPLSGIETALSLGLAEFNVIVSCDLANLRREWLEALLAAAQRGPACAAIKDASGQLQPLCGVYRPACLKIVETALRNRQLRMMDLLTALGANLVEIDETVMNWNTPEDYARNRE